MMMMMIMQIKCDEEIDALRARASLVFLDAMLAHDALDQSYSSIVDELSVDLISICGALVYAVKYCHEKLSHLSTMAAIVLSTVPCSNVINNHSKPQPSQSLPLTSSTDESILWTEMMNKALLAAELLCTIKGSSVCLRDLLANSGAPFVRCHPVIVESVSSIIMTLHILP